MQPELQSFLGTVTAFTRTKFIIMSSESLSASFVDARSVLQSLHDTLETRAEWRQLSDDLVRQTHQDELTQLQQRADQARNQLHALESQWPTIEKSLDARRTTLQQRREQTEWRCNALNDATVELKSELAQLDMEDLLRSAREKSWLDKRDISTLPASVHQRIVMFLESHDLAQMLRVCLPWARALDHGYVWQAFLARDTLAARRTKRVDKLAMMPSGPQRSISFTLLETNDTLTKDLIFSRALKSLKEQYDDAYSSREDLLTSCNVSGQVRAFLQQKFESLRHQIGDTSVDMHRLERNARQDAKVKSALAKRIHAVEKELEIDEESYEPFVEQADKTIRELDAQIKILEDIQHTTHVDMENEVQQLRAEKKLLIKEVKNLRTEMACVQSECDQAESQLEKLRGALQDVLNL